MGSSEAIAKAATDNSQMCSDGPCAAAGMVEHMGSYELAVPPRSSVSSLVSPKFCTWPLFGEVARKRVNDKKCPRPGRS